MLVRLRKLVIGMLGMEGWMKKPPPMWGWAVGDTAPKWSSGMPDTAQGQNGASSALNVSFSAVRCAGSVIPQAACVTLWQHTMHVQHSTYWLGLPDLAASCPWAEIPRYNWPCATSCCPQVPLAALTYVASHPLALEPLLGPLWCSWLFWFCGCQQVWAPRDQEHEGRLMSPSGLS